MKVVNFMSDRNRKAFSLNLTDTCKPSWSRHCCINLMFLRSTAAISFFVVHYKWKSVWRATHDVWNAIDCMLVNIIYAPLKLVLICKISKALLNKQLECNIHSQ